MTKKPKAGDANKRELLMILRSLFGDEVVMEYRFHQSRMWRFDYAIPSLKIACEYQGHSGFIGGKASGHSTIKGLTNDCEKFNSAVQDGWRVIIFTALHFRESERVKHKLASPLERLQNILKEPKTTKVLPRP